MQQADGSFLSSVVPKEGRRRGHHIEVVNSQCTFLAVVARILFVVMDAKGVSGTTGGYAPEEFPSPAREEREHDGVFFGLEINPSAKHEHK